MPFSDIGHTSSREMSTPYTVAKHRPPPARPSPLTPTNPPPKTASTALTQTHHLAEQSTDRRPTGDATNMAGCGTPRLGHVALHSSVPSSFGCHRFLVGHPALSCFSNFSASLCVVPLSKMASGVLLWSPLRGRPPIRPVSTYGRLGGRWIGLAFILPTCQHGRCWSPVLEGLTG